MARPTLRDNRFFWELIIAFSFIVSAAVFHTFHFFNNAWLTQGGPSIQYQRGLGDDCVKSEQFVDDGIRCTEWGAVPSTFVLNGKGISEDNVNPPSAGLKVARVLMVVSVLLYLVVIFAVFVVCVKKQDLRIQQTLCVSSLLLILLNLIIIMLVFVASFFPFINNKGQCWLGSAYYYFLLSNVLLWIGSIAHLDNWLDVYSSLQPVHVPARVELNTIDDTRIPTFMHL